jgi:tRNA(fMet)-specific endonuclease VapC
VIVDTSVLITLERGSPQVTHLFDDADDAVIAAITAEELLVGVELATDLHRASRARYVRSVLETFPVEDYTLDVARAHARLSAHIRRTGRPRGLHDLVIAATAVATDRVVVTADVRGFADLPGVVVRS